MTFCQLMLFTELYNAKQCYHTIHPMRTVLLFRL